MFEEEFGEFLEEQKSSARGQRLAMLNRDLTGTKKVLEPAVWPVLKSFKGIVLEHEMVSVSGVRIYGDVFCEELNSVIEHEGYVVHAETITRDRFSFEHMRVRTMAMYGYRYIPFSWDDLDKKPEFCRRTMYELLGRFGTSRSRTYFDLSVDERELLRYALRLNRSFRMADVCFCLQSGDNAGRKVLRKLFDRKLAKPVSNGTQRHHEYVLEKTAVLELL